MAFEGTWTTNSGLVATNAYVVIERILWRKGEEPVATAVLYKDIAARDANKNPINSLNFDFTYDDQSTDDIRTQAYHTLTNHPKLSGFSWTATE